MRPPLRAALLFALLAVSSGFATAQVENQSASVRLGRSQPFFADALNFASYDEFGMASRLDVYVHIPFDLITFVRKDLMYVGSYTMTAVVTGSDGERLAEETWTRKIEKIAFESTVAPGAYDISQRTISAQAGSVNLELIFEDRESRKEFRVTRQIEIRRYDPNIFDMSDVMLASRIDVKDGRRHITPQLDPNVAGLTNGFHLFYEVYNPLAIDRVRVTAQVSRRGQPLFTVSDTQRIRQGITPFITNIGTSALSVGPYTIDVTLSRLEDTTAAGVLTRRGRAFVVEWLSGGTPINISDLNEAIEQLRYFARSEDLDRMKTAEDDDERRRLFEEFWERHNPTPGAQPNRAMVEYYSRVAYANENFRHYIDGWKSDRGMVYIMYGPPSYVDRHPLDVESKPYEIWEYYDINRRYIFVDESGFGDYRLLYPIWDDRNRMR